MKHPCVITDVKIMPEFFHADGTPVSPAELLSECGRLRTKFQKRHGPRPKFNEEQQAEIFHLYTNKGFSADDLATKFDVTESLIYKILRKQRKKGPGATLDASEKVTGTSDAENQVREGVHPPPDPTEV